MLDIFIKTGPQKAGAKVVEKKKRLADPCRSWRGVRFNGIEQSFSSKPNDRVRLDLDQPPQPTGCHYGRIVGFKDGSAQEIGQSFPANQ